LLSRNGNFRKWGLWLAMVSLLAGMLPAAALADPPGGSLNGLNNYVVEAIADPPTSTPPATFGTAAGDGQVWADKSVALNANGVDFDVTLSALAQEYIRTAAGGDVVQAAADVAVVLDLSLSMNGDRLSAMVKAANKAIDIIMAANPRNRIGVYYFSTTAGSGTLMPLASYSTPQTGDGSDAVNRYLTNPANDQVRLVSGITRKFLDGTEDTTTQTTISTAAATAVQFGLYHGIHSLISDISLRDLEDYTQDSERLPFVLLLADGEANRAFVNWWADLTDPGARGTERSGSGASGTAEIAALTVLSAAKLKDELKEAYSVFNEKAVDVVWFNVGLDLPAGDDNLSKAVMNPNIIETVSGTTLNDVKNQLISLTSSAPAAPVDYSKYGAGGNPGYVYAQEYIYFTQSNDLSTINQAFTDLAELVKAATQQRSIPFEPTTKNGEPINLLITDVLGEGMELKSAPKMQGISGTVGSVNGTVTAYEFSGYRNPDAGVDDSSGRTSADRLRRPGQPDSGHLFQSERSARQAGIYGGRFGGLRFRRHAVQQRVCRRGDGRRPVHPDVGQSVLLQKHCGRRR